MCAMPHHNSQSGLASDSQLYKDIQQILKHWVKPEVSNRLDYLYAAQRLDNPATLTQSSTRQLVLEAICELDGQQPELATLVRSRFLDGAGPTQVAQQQSISETELYRRQKDALSHLAAIIHARESYLRQAMQLRFQKRIPPAGYSHLYGMGAHIAHLLTKLAEQSGSHIISIEGIGGIGKTALAHATIERAINQHRFADYGWVSLQRQKLIPDGDIQNVYSTTHYSADQVIAGLAAQIVVDMPAPMADQRFDRLYECVKSKPHLLIIDNLETLDDCQALLPLLQKLANPSVIVITSRYQVKADAAIYAYKVPELDSMDALKLLRSEMADSGFDGSKYLDADLLPVVSIVGGNPLALKLAVGQLAYSSLSHILESLKEANCTSIENLYTFIYHRAWELLEQESKEVLLGTLTLPEAGGEIGRLQQAVGVERNVLNNALRHLVKLNLVDCHHGNIPNDAWYRIHSLTRSFLHTQVLGWE